MTNVKELFKAFRVRSTSKRDGRYGYRNGKNRSSLDDAVTDLYQDCKNEGLNKRQDRYCRAIRCEKTRASKKFRWWICHGWTLGHGDSFVLETQQEFDLLIIIKMMKLL
jgi:amidophosphoribosyltransferase